MAKHLQQIDRLPPWDADAEKSVLGCILQEPQSCMAECVLKLRSGPDSFYDLRHQTIYRAMVELYDDRKPIDTVILHEHLNAGKQLENVGGTGYVSELADYGVHFNIAEYLDIVLRKYLLRKIINLCVESVASAYEANGEARECLDRFEAQALAIRSNVEPVGGIADIRAVQCQLEADYDLAYTKQSAVGIHTGFTDLDHRSGGMMEQEMIILAGLRSTGKTSLAASIAFNVARAGIGVGFISLETSAKKLVHRLGCNAGQFDGSLLLRGLNAETVLGKATVGFDRLRACQQHLLISDAGPLSPIQLAAICRRMFQAGARLFVVDYLQLLNCPGQKEYDRATYASKAIKNLAKELNCPVIALCSLSRDSDKEARRPRLSDLRASGQIEYDADKVWLLSNADAKESDSAVRGVVLDVAKNKDGPTGDLRLTFFANEFRMASGSRIEDEHQQELQARQTHADA
jgi:replicative DNA helicase